MLPPAELVPAGDRAVLVRLGRGIDPQVQRRVLGLWWALRSEPFPGFLQAVPSYDAVLVSYDPAAAGYEEVRSAVLAAAERASDVRLPAPRRITLPVAYGGTFGPDLPFVAAHAGLGESDVVAIHAAGDYLVHFIGFAPGFPYLGGMSQRIAAPRLPQPRTRVPAGSVGIAGRQTGIYPVETPGGWRLIGCTPVRLFDPAWDPPVLLRPGDRVRFRPVDHDAFQRIRAQVEAGTYRPEVEIIDDADPAAGG